MYRLIFSCFFQAQEKITPRPSGAGNEEQGRPVSMSVVGGGNLTSTDIGWDSLGFVQHPFGWEGRAARVGEDLGSPSLPPSLY